MTDYLKDRILVYDTKDGAKTYKITGGVPQGSALGPLTWNGMYDRVLRLKSLEGALVIGFADDIAVVVVAKHKEAVTKIADKAIDKIHEWLIHVGAALSRLMPNIGEPSQKRWLLLASVTTSIMLYVAPTWADAIFVKTYA